MYPRRERIQELVKEELGQILLREMRDPRLGFVTITDVELSGDLRRARVYVSVMGSAEKQEESLAVLRGAIGFLRRELGRRLSLRYIPDLTFSLDHTAERAARIEALLVAEARRSSPRNKEPEP
ncbi:MAG TPA: 30S ribosome-binding factor RbfA [Armatimonadetes bacterium]|nr:30S ribosome-binding factor RbfA [Armatimonadota bacterium]